MIYNTKNRKNDTTESQKEKKACFNAHFQYIQSKEGLNKMWSLKSLAIHFVVMLCGTGLALFLAYS